MDRTGIVYKYLVELDEGHWNWHANLPNIGDIKSKDVRKWFVDHGNEKDRSIRLENMLAEEENFNDGDSENGKSVAGDVDKLRYLAWKLVNDADERNKFLKAVKHFQEYFYYASKPDLQIKLKQIREALDGLA